MIRNGDRILISSMHERGADSLAYLALLALDGPDAYIRRANRRYRQIPNILHRSMAQNYSRPPHSSALMIQPISSKGEDLSDCWIGVVIAILNPYRGAIEAECKFRLLVSPSDTLEHSIQLISRRRGTVESVDRREYRKSESLSRGYRGGM